MITVKMEEYEVVDMLINRLRRWTDDEGDIELYKKMYESFLDCGGEIELNVNQIVDNDWCNWCTTISQGDDNFDEILELYKNGERDISCEDLGYSSIEAVSGDETKILVRY